MQGRNITAGCCARADLLTVAIDDPDPPPICLVSRNADAAISRIHVAARQNLAGFTCERGANCGHLRCTSTSTSSIVQPAAHGYRDGSCEQWVGCFGLPFGGAGPGTGRHLAPDDQCDTQATLPAVPGLHENRKP